MKKVNKRTLYVFALIAFFSFRCSDTLFAKQNAVEIGDKKILLNNSSSEYLFDKKIEKGIGILNFDYTQFSNDSCFLNIYVNGLLIKQIKTMGEPQNGDKIEIRDIPVLNKKVSELKFIAIGGPIEVSNIQFDDYSFSELKNQQPVKFFKHSSENFALLMQNAKILNSKNGVSWRLKNAEKSILGISLSKKNGVLSSSPIKGGVGYIRFDIFRVNNDPIVFDVVANGKIVQHFDMTSLPAVQRQFTSGILPVLISDDVSLSFSNKGASFSIGNIHWGNQNDMGSDYGYIKYNPSSPYQYKANLSIEELWKTNAKLIIGLLDSLNLELKGLEQVKKNALNRDYVKAAYALLEYYKLRGRMSEYFLQKPISTIITNQKFDKYFNFNVNYQDDKWWRIPLRANGTRDYHPLWPNYPSDWRDPYVNRQTYLLEILHVWHKTGNPKYATLLDILISDWIAASPTDEARENFPNINLDEAIRMRNVWSELFFGLQEADEFAPATRILMLTSILEQCNDLLFKTTVSRYTNIYLHSKSALITIAANFPEFKSSKMWAKYAIDKVDKVLNSDLIYPDGISSEMATSYATNQAFDLTKLILEIKKGKFEIPDGMLTNVENQWNAHIYSMQPTGEIANYGDSKRRSLIDTYFKGNDSLVLKIFPRNDWKYIMSNGKAGVEPISLPSQFFPYSGQVIMRNNWTEKAHWSMFDIGVRGTSGHAHLDKLHISVTANGYPFLIDAGKPLYENAVGADVLWRKYYFKGSAGHNVILIDNQIQNETEFANPNKIEGQFLANDTLTFAIGSEDKFENLKAVKHTRALLYLKNKYWVVIDKVDLDKERILDVLWHFDEKCDVVVQNNKLISKQGNVNFSIVPIGENNWNIRIAKGETTPNIQGWENNGYSRQGNPIPTGIYSTKTNSAVFGWVLCPDGGAVPEITTRIIETTNSTLKIEVIVNGEKDVMEIPLENFSSPIIF